MLVYAFTRRVREVGIRSLWLAAQPGPVKVLYIDAGLHKSARELNLVHRWFNHLPQMQFVGFEGNPAYCAEAADAVPAGVEVVHCALVGPEHGDTVTLNLDGQSGEADSLFRKVTDLSIAVPATRLSAYLTARSIDPSRTVILLRMNIEGAEVPVLQDLAVSKLIDCVDGFYGQWEGDIYAIGGHLIDEFEVLEREHDVRRLSFSGGRAGLDISSPFRRFYIWYDLNTSILRGSARKACA
jgi:hypothetical protein